MAAATLRSRGRVEGVRGFSRSSPSHAHKPTNPRRRRSWGRQRHGCQIDNAIGRPTTARPAGVPSLTMLGAPSQGRVGPLVPTLSKGAPTGNAPGRGRVGCQAVEGNSTGNGFRTMTMTMTMKTKRKTKSVGRGWGPCTLHHVPCTRAGGGSGIWHLKSGRAGAPLTLGATVLRMVSVPPRCVRRRSVS
jgi:hypothetical protein